MFEFFLALFGGLYYTGKYCNEKSTLKKFDTRNKKLFDELDAENESWLKKVVDEKLEFEIKFCADNTINDMYARIITEAKVTSVSPDMIVMGLLAQKGKIPKRIAEKGIHSRGVWDYEEKLQWKEQRKFLLWYDRELGKNGIKEPLLFVNGVNEHNVRFNMSSVHPIANCTEMIGGRYFWEPMRKNVF